MRLRFDHGVHSSSMTLSGPNRPLARSPVLPVYNKLGLKFPLPNFQRPVGIPR